MSHDCIWKQFAHTRFVFETPFPRENNFKNKKRPADTRNALTALFFAELKFSDQRIGLFMTLTLVGDVILGIVLTMVADRVGRRKIILTGSLLMIMSGTVFALFENFWILLAAAVLGVISTSGGDFGPFRAIEECVESTSRSFFQSGTLTNSQIYALTTDDPSNKSRCAKLVHHFVNIRLRVRQ
jgi:hypothetical protein